MSTSLLSEPPVTLKGGLSVSAAALRALWDLEDRGLIVKTDNHGRRLLVGPADRLTAEDRTVILKHRMELIALLHYVDEVVA